jgi:pteridine reductase
MGLLNLDGRAALVTGGGTRVGVAIVQALARAGCDVVIHFATNAKGAKAAAADVEATGRRAAVLQADLRDRSAIDALARSARGAFGGIDVLVHNAASFERVVPGALSAAAWDGAMALNATAPYLLTVALAESLRERTGCVVAITCLSASRPWKNYVPYSASKAALEHLVRGLAVGLAPHVRVNAVAPGTVLPPSDYEDGKLRRMRERIPLGRFGDPDDVARAVVFFAENDYLTGQTLGVDGGRSVT